MTIKYATGADPSGARDLLVSMWNQANPRATVVVDEVGGNSTRDQRNGMISRAVSGEADVLNLDVINISHFKDKNYITPVQIDDAAEFIPSTLLPSQLGDPNGSTFWAVPFNTDVGLVYKRIKPDTMPAGEEVPPLSQAIGRYVQSGSKQFAGQLEPSSLASREAFVVNMLEHALSIDNELLNVYTGMPILALERWQAALGPLQSAIVDERITRSDSETSTRTAFRQLGLSYMRNWPAEYRELQQDGDPDSRVDRIKVGPLPGGVLGGGSLAISAKAPQARRAAEFVRFLTGEPAQHIIASYAIAPSRSGVYEDAGLQAYIPHLRKIRGAVEDARPRPISAGYQEFSDAVAVRFKDLLAGKPLTTDFIKDVQRTLETK